MDRLKLILYEVHAPFPIQFATKMDFAVMLYCAYDKSINVESPYYNKGGLLSNTNIVLYLLW